MSLLLPLWIYLTVVNRSWTTYWYSDVGYVLNRSYTLCAKDWVNLASDCPTSKNESVKSNSGVRSYLKLEAGPRVLRFVTLDISSRMNLKSNLHPLWATIVLKGTQWPLRYAWVDRLWLWISFDGSSIMPSSYIQVTNF